MDDHPPSYEASSADSKGASKRPSGHARPWSFADEVIISRSEHVAATASKVQAILQGRARYGVSSVTLVLVPRGQIEFSRNHEVVEFEGMKYVLVELSEEADSAEFWSQPQVVQDLRRWVLNGLNGEYAARPELTRANVRLEECHFRSESAFGLKETAVAKCIVLELET